MVMVRGKQDQVPYPTNHKLSCLPFLVMVVVHRYFFIERVINDDGILLQS